MTELERFLVSDAPQNRVTGDALRNFGRDAAIKFVSEGTALNTTITDMAKTANLNAEQIGRVAEFANNDTFALLFKRGFEKNIVFPVADAAVISTTVTTAPVKLASVVTFRKQAHSALTLDTLFRTSSEKTAAAVSQGPTARGFIALKDELKSLRSTEEECMTLLADQLQKVACLCKQALQEDNTIDEIAGAIQASSAPSIVQGSVLKGLGFSGPFEKTAGAQIFTANPITVAMNEIAATMGRLESTHKETVAKEAQAKTYKDSFGA